MRDNPKSIEPFLENNGLAVLLKATQSPIERLQTKSCFLLSVLCKENRKIRGKEVNTQIHYDQLHLLSKFIHSQSLMLPDFISLQEDA